MKLPFAVVIDREASGLGVISSYFFIYLNGGLYLKWWNYMIERVGCIG